MKYLLKLGRASLHRYPADQKFAEITISRTVFEIQAFMWFAIFCKKFEKLKMADIFGETKIFWKIGSVTQQRYPVDQKFH